ncbi:MAG: hypothetical protein EKK48_16900 [Candidatus Melainabacteria bacterium]|nr:MAG: hypothetical protein EKK48_16900 [Candidatus Melainabacteria bacterium]
MGLVEDALAAGEPDLDQRRVDVMHHAQGLLSHLGEVETTARRAPASSTALTGAVAVRSLLPRATGRGSHVLLAHMNVLLGKRRSVASGLTYEESSSVLAP